MLFSPLSLDLDLVTVLESSAVVMELAWAAGILCHIYGVGKQQ